MAANPNKLAVAVFLKYPEPGQVKTRLAKTLGEDEAARIYFRLLAYLFEHTLSHLDKKDFAVHWVWDPFRKFEDYERLLSVGDYPFLQQKGNSLGERLSHCFMVLHQRFPKVLVIGSDCIDVTPELVSRFSRELETHHLAIGPANDGGYYGIGTQKYHKELFEEVPWSSDKVLERTLHIASNSGLTTWKGPVLRDIDDSEDWNRFKPHWKKIMECRALGDPNF